MTLRGAKTLRLTHSERDRWRRITGFDPAEVRSEADLRQFVAMCKQHYWGTGQETCMLHRLIDAEMDRNLAPAAQT